MKMKTEILKQVASLRLEKTFLNLRLAVKISKYDEAYPLRNEEHEQQRLPHVERKWSSDSGIVTDEYNHKHQVQVVDWSQKIKYFIMINSNINSDL